SYGIVRYWYLPTALWLNASDAALHAWCAIGTLGALLVVLDVAPALSLAVAGVSYLTLAIGCQDFLWFHWDGLLLATVFLGTFLAPWRLMPRGGDAPPSRLARGLVIWLLFRLYVSSAAIKLTSGDPTWRNLTALRYHYETQPLPPWSAWYAHHLPPWFQSFSVGVMFAIEGLVPFL